MNPEQDRHSEEELKDILRQIKDEIRLRDVKLTNIEWQLRLKRTSDSLPKNGPSIRSWIAYAQGGIVFKRT